MFWYRFCGEWLASAVELPELGGGYDRRAPAPENQAKAWRCAPGPVTRPGRLIHQWREPEDDVWLQIFRSGRAHQLVFTLGIAFHLDGRTVTWSAPSSIPDDTLRHLLLDQALPLAFSAADMSVLHGSAVMMDGRAVLFVGKSGRGKSTLAAWFASRDHTVLADDCLRIDERCGEVILWPAYPGLRMAPDAARHVFSDRMPELARVGHYTPKLRVALRSGGDDPLPVARIYLLHESAGPDALVRPASAASIVDLIRCTFRMDIEDRGALAGDFASASQLVERSLVRHLHVPRALAQLPEVAAAVATDLAAPRASGRCA